MQHDQKQLFQIACDYPWYLFTAEEISVLCNVGEHKVRLARNAKDTPFRFNLCRPEWFTGWMLDHPQYQDLKSAPIDAPESTEACAVFVKQTFDSRPVRAVKKTAKARQKRISAQPFKTKI
jgi:hypothetical protein